PPGPRAQELHPGLRLVLAIYNRRLGDHLRLFFPDCTVLSGTAMWAPSFVAAARGEPAARHARGAARPGPRPGPAAPPLRAQARRRGARPYHLRPGHGDRRSGRATATPAGYPPGAPGVRGRGR